MFHFANSAFEHGKLLGFRFLNLETFFRVSLLPREAIIRHGVGVLKRVLSSGLSGNGKYLHHRFTERPNKTPPSPSLEGVRTIFFLPIEKSRDSAS